LGKPITMTHYQDANLYHDIITGWSVTAILHFLNKFPIDWYSKKQATIEKLHMEVSTSQQGPVSTKLWIYEKHCDTSAFQSETWATCLETTNRSSTAPLSHTPSCTRDTMLYPFIVFVRPLHLDTLCWLTYLESSTLRISWASIGDTRLSGRSSSLSCSSMEIQQTSLKMTILFRYSSYRNYLLRYMCINFLGNRPQADGEWQKLHSHANTCDGLFICQLYSLPDLLEEMDLPLMLPFWIVHFPLTVYNSDVN
jgi:hypothetical protein